MESENIELRTKNQRMEEQCNMLLESVEMVKKLVKEIEAKNKVLKVQLGKAREGKGGRGTGEVKAEEQGVVDDEEGLKIKGAGAGESGITEKVVAVEEEVTVVQETVTVAAKTASKGAMKSAKEVMQDLVAAAEKKEAEINSESVTIVVKDELTGESEWTLDEEHDEEDVDYTLVEDEVDYGYDELDGSETAVVEPQSKKRKASEDGDEVGMNDSSSKRLKSIK